ncbi:galectin-5-like [Physella acuta]|uniref:galectin-5-like n=1 Tax=Physella acuta TaxID=109671 RepID=UPI0027DE5AA5|nr:galectin-5-like [Physella acuta]
MYLDLPCGIAVGNMVVLKGVYLNDTGFTLNLKNAANIILNFRPRIKNLPVVTLNYKYNNVWGTEWVPLYNTFPFNVGQPFSLHILAGGTGYVIFIDGKWFSNFTYVMPTTSARYFELTGAIKLLELSV